MTATKRKPKPITAHPLFPAVTALWFAAFFSIGSFAIAPALLEGPVLALGIPALVPAAAPPLGFTARVMLALAMLAVGALSGFIVGRRLAPRTEAAPRRRSPERATHRPDATEETRRPLNPMEDLGEPLTGSDETGQPLQRRRALSLTDEGQLAVPSEDAPLPGFLPWERPVVSAREAPEPAAPPSLGDEDPLALEGLIEAADALRAEAGQRTAPPFPADPAAIQVQAEPRPAEPASSKAAAPLLQAPAADVTPLERASLDSLGMVQLIERLALAISRRPAPARDTAALESSAYAAPAQKVRPASPPAVASPDPEVPLEAAAPSIDTQRVIPLRPLALEPVGMIANELTADDSDADEAESLGLARFLKVPATAKSSSEPVEESTSEPEVAEDRYPSLLDMGPATVRHAAPRIDDGLGLEPDDDEDSGAPAVVFPGQVSPLQGVPRRFERPSILAVQGSPLAAPGRAAPSTPAEAIEPVEVRPGAALPDPEEADRALRAALATLQRMTAQG